MTNKEVLNSFIKYCKENPNQRFWQALRNWSMFNFIWVSNSRSIDEHDLKDTFYFTEIAK